MAKKKKNHKKRRVSGIRSVLSPRSPITLLLGAAAGFGADMVFGINSGIDRAMITLTPATSTTPATATAPSGIMKYAPTAGELGLGAYLAFKRRKTTITTLAGGAMLGMGVHRALVELGVMTGYQSVPVIGRRMHGYQRTPVISGIPGQLQGIPGQLQGFRVNGYGSQGSGVLAGTEYRNGSGYMN